MEKEETKTNNNHKPDLENEEDSLKSDNKNKETEEKLSPEKEVEVLKDKLARTFAEMENQRRRYEKEKEEAFEYGGFNFAREALNLIDNLELSLIHI